MSPWRVLVRRLAAAALVSLASAPSSAQDGFQDWRWTIAPYLAGVSLTGETAIGQLHATLDADALDILSHIEFAFMAYVEAMKGDWGVGLDIMYAELSAPLSDPSGELTITQGTYTAALIRQITPRTRAYAGARWNSLGAKIVLSGTGGDSQKDRDWVDPVLGGSVDRALSERWRFSATGDVGGFGLGSKLSAQLWPNIFLNIATNGRLGLGYRLLYVNYRDDEGARYFEYDVLTHGPTFGFVFLLGGA
jgi:hypothetical protein